MSAVLTIDGRGDVALEIADAEGELHLYEIRPASPAVGLRAVWVRRLDTGQEYRVAQLSPTRWECACPAWVYLRRKQGDCKHVLAVRPLLLLADTLPRCPPEPTSCPPTATLSSPASPAAPSPI